LGINHSQISADQVRLKFLSPMAATACTWVPTGLTAPRRHRKPITASQSRASFIGLRLGNTLDSKAQNSFQSQTAVCRSFSRITCALNPSLVISLSTGASLFLGRFVFLSFQRDNVAKQGLPSQNGQTHFEAGDTRATEYVNLLKSNDPAGFNIVDVLAWGSIGHIVAYFILATSSNGYNPNFF
jgi:photosystem I subunit V